MLGEIYAEAQSKFNNPVNLKRLINLVDETHWTELGVDVKAEAYEGLLEKAASEGIRSDVSGAPFLRRPSQANSSLPKPNSREPKVATTSRPNSCWRESRVSATSLRQRAREEQQRLP